MPTKILGEATCPLQTRTSRNFPQRVQVPNDEVLGFWVVVLLAQALGKYMIIRYLDPWGSQTCRSGMSMAKIPNGGKLS